jgi:MFS superfamily sulfate permease-like transporter
VHELQIPGDPLSGYKRALAIAVVAGLIQILLSRAKFSRVVDLIPTSVIHGMLAAIGVIVIAKQLPILMGTTPLKNLSPLESFLNIPTYLSRENPVLLAIGIASLAAMWCTPYLNRFKIFKTIPIPLFIVTAAVLVSLGLGLMLAISIRFLGQLTKLARTL